MPRKPEVRGSSAVEIAHSIEQSILAGHYPSGMRLPTVRELAQHLGVNKNTVSRAYQILSQRGYLNAARGRGAFVRLPVNHSNGAADTASHWQAALRSVLLRARQEQVTYDQALTTTLLTLDELYAHLAVRVAFVECNQTDVTDLGGRLEECLGYPVQPVLLADVAKEPDGILQEMDIITTSFFHLSEVRRLAGSRRDHVIGLNVIPVLEVLLDIARLDVVVIGVVCDVPSAQESLVHIVQTYHPNVTVLAALTSDETRLVQVITKSDVLVVTQSAARFLADHKPICPVIVVNWTIEQQSVDYLRQKVEAVRLQHHSTQ